MKVSQTEVTVGSKIIQVNGGSGNPDGFDIQDGKIVAIGANVRVWLTPSSPYNGIAGDSAPACADPAHQIKYYDQSGNANSDSSKYSDIFVVGDKTGGFYKQSDWTGGKEDFRPLQGITGNRGNAGQVGKDYIFVKGESTDYKVTYSSNNNPNTADNTYDGLKVTDSSGKGLYGNSNQIEGVIFGNGGTTTNPGTTTTVVETKVQHVTLDVDVNLSSDHNAEQLTQIKLTGIPEGAKLVVSDGSTVTYKDGTYTIDLKSPDFKGTITVELAKGVAHLGEIQMEVASTASEHHDTHFTFDGSTGHLNDAWGDTDPVTTPGNDAGSHTGTGSDADAGQHTTPVTTPTVASRVEAAVQVAESDIAVGSKIVQINGGSENPNGFDVQDGKIVAIGSNVRVWLTQSSNYLHIAGDEAPKAADPANQIKYYDQSGNVNSNSGHYSDIFVVGDKTGGYYRQSDWTGGREEFRELKNFAGTRGAEGSVGKDYVFVKGESSNYKVTYSSNNNASTHDNTYDGLKVTTTGGKGLYENSNQIEGVIFGDGASKTHGGATTTTVVQPSIHQVALDVNVALISEHSADHLTELKLSGIPEGAKVVSSDGSHAVWKDGVYSFDLSGTSFKGTVTVELAKGVDHLDEIKMDVASTASDHPDTHFTFDGETGEQTHVPEMMFSRMMLVENNAIEGDAHDTAHDSATGHDAEPNAQTPGGDMTIQSLLVAEDGIALHHIESDPVSAQNSALAFTQQAENSLSNLLGEMDDSHVDTAHSAVTPSTQDAPSADTASANGTQPIVLSEVLSDTDTSHDLSSLIKVVEQGDGTQTANDAAQGHATPVAEPLPALAAETDSYHGADESLMESLIAKPDTLA